MLKVGSLAERVPALIWQYAVAVVSVGVALIITNSRSAILHYGLLFLAIILSAWFGRMGPGLLAVGLSTLAVDRYFAPAVS